MWGSILLSFREAFEAALVVGIILTHLTKIERKDLIKFVYAGIILGIIVSLAGGIIGFNEAKEAEEEGEGLIGGIMYLLSAGLIAYFILWMHKAQNVAVSVNKKVAKNTSAIGLFVLAFLSVTREGVELITFSLTKITESALSVGAGSLIGISLAIIFGGLVFKTSVKLNLGFIFKALGVLLIFVGGSMFGEGLGMLVGGGELTSNIALFVFAVPALLIYFQHDLKKFKGATAWSK